MRKGFENKMRVQKVRGDKRTQGTQGPQGREGKRLTLMDLTPEQREAIKPIIDKYVKHNQNFISEISDSISDIITIDRPKYILISVATNELGNSLSREYIQSKSFQEEMMKE